VSINSKDIIRPKRSETVKNLVIISEVKPKSAEFQGF
jgi:hypothetical protein